MKDLDNIFKEKLADYQAPVDPAAWSAVQNGIGAAGGGATGAATGSVFVKALVGLVAAAVISAGVYLVIDKENSSEIIGSETAHTTVQEPKESQVDIDSPILDLDNEPVIVKEERIQRSSLPVDDQVLVDVKNQSIAKGNDVNQPEPIEKQVPIISETNETELNPVGTSVSHNINRGHDEMNELNIPAETEALTASFYGVQDEYNAMRFELIPEMEEAHAYTWELDGQYFSEKQLDYTFEHSGVYPVVLTVTGKTGKLEKQTLELEVFVQPEFVAPEIFTPNNDNKNPILDFEALSKGIRILETQVFSLSGELVFKSDEYSKYWDGNQRNGEPCPQGQYLWIVIYQTDSGEEIKDQGYVTIKR
ncbi:MAG: gliding motility-associated C-terminal domain-containing protein [Flavobacteriales bacterium]